MAAPRAALVLAACAALAQGCALDFEQFRLTSDRPRPDDVTPITDASADAVDAAEAGFDAPAADASLDAPVDVSDAKAACVPEYSAMGSFRFAHMASDFGPVELCMRRRSVDTAFTSAASPTWPEAGVDYGQMTLAQRFSVPLAVPNEAWEFAVVAAGDGCANAATTAITRRSAQLDPGVSRLLVLTTEYGSNGTPVGVLNVMVDQVCTDCAPREVDVRAVHVSSGAAASRVSVAIEPVADLNLFSSELLSYQVFASNVSYGAASDYTCNPMWGAFYQEMYSVYEVQLAARTPGGTLIARSVPTRLKSSLLESTRLVSVFFEGPRDRDPGFVLCYDAVTNGALAACDRVPAMAPASTDASVDADNDASVDAESDAATDASWSDAGADAHGADASADDASVDDAGAWDATVRDAAPDAAQGMDASTDGAASDDSAAS